LFQTFRRHQQGCEKPSQGFIYGNLWEQFDRHFSSHLIHFSRNSTDMKLINIGFGNIVSANRVVAIVSPESAPIKRIISEARDRGQLVDATYGRRTRAVMITDSGHVVLSAIQPETVAHRFVGNKDLNSKDLAQKDVAKKDIASKKSLNNK
jgi:extracellular matrix regulatory protein A